VNNRARFGATAYNLDKVEPGPEVALNQNKG
jgi:hypothetical protein